MLKEFQKNTLEKYIMRFEILYMNKIKTWQPINDDIKGVATYSCQIKARDVDDNEHFTWFEMGDWWIDTWEEDEWQNDYPVTRHWNPTEYVSHESFGVK